MKELSLINCRLDQRYEIREQLGRGSYAEIYVARDLFASPRSPHSTVVLKALNVFLQNDLDEALERTLVQNFQNEAVALDRVRHPNIISRLGHGTARDLEGTVFHYLVLEYLAGGDMQQLLRSRKLSCSEAVSHIEQVCSGLGHAHGCGIIHRDIKPQNLLLSADHVTKIADFGVARDSSIDSPITRVGTNAYAPPEHSPLGTGSNGDTRLTPASDIYSLGKTIYAMLAGESPRRFANTQITELPESIGGEEWADGLLAVLKRATEIKPAARYQTVAELWRDLSGVFESIQGDGPATVLSSTDPKPHVSRGYSPIAPAGPSFESRSALIGATTRFQVQQTGLLTDTNFSAPIPEPSAVLDVPSIQPAAKPVVVSSARRGAPCCGA
jgi:eukaryotic-like serine/threonine-protein kinase